MKTKKDKKSNFLYQFVTWTTDAKPIKKDGFLFDRKRAEEEPEEVAAELMEKGFWDAAAFVMDTYME